MPQDALWYKDAVIYQVHVRTFFDSNGDGIGDFRGLAQKLDYLQELGIKAIWLMPFFPSPLNDDGYDIADYRIRSPHLWHSRRLQAFSRCGARARHSRHHRDGVEPHFRSASLVPGITQFPRQPARDWYVWSDTDTNYRVRALFSSIRSFPIGRGIRFPRQYYWHRFFSHQPDLNYDNPAVREEMWKVMQFWLDMGVDGFRLDAVPYLVEREGTYCENLPEPTRS